MNDATPAPSQCPSCAGVDRHTTICPEALGVWDAKGDEVCGKCREPIVAMYSHLEHTPGVEVAGEPDLLVCLGCKVQAIVGTLP